MSSLASHLKLDPRQAIKVVVYSLLLVNFALYIADDLRIASYTMRNSGSLLEWTAAFATTIDETAWFALLFLFELETYVLSDEVQSRPGVVRLVHGIRLLCYLSLGHSIYAFGDIYLDLVRVMKAATLVLTDSGGIQEEAPTFGVPVLVLREVTERPEGIEAGVASLVGTDRDRIVEVASGLLDHGPGGSEGPDPSGRNPYGDGRAGARIADIVISGLTGAPRQTADWAGYSVPAAP